MLFKNMPHPKRSWGSLVEKFSERDCEYGDGCPPFGSRHGQCDACAGKDAEEIRDNIRRSLKTLGDAICCLEDPTTLLMGQVGLMRLCRQLGFDYPLVEDDNETQSQFKNAAEPLTLLSKTVDMGLGPQEPPQKGSLKGSHWSGDF